MIIEGKHAEVGQGIFISDIQEGSAAEQVTHSLAPHFPSFSNDRFHSSRHTWLLIIVIRIIVLHATKNGILRCIHVHFYFALLQAGLQVGDMILAVNMDCLLGSTYDEVRIVGNHRFSLLLFFVNKEKRRFEGIRLTIDVWKIVQNFSAMR